MRTHPGPARVTVAVLAVAALAVGPAGCTFDRTDPVPLPQAPADDVTWRACPEVPQELVGAAAPHMTYECATVAVPRDWSAPESGETFELALIRVRSDRQEDRIGSLVLNPGGPGGSGIDVAVYLSYGPMFGGMPDDVTRRFDLVGFDPRGVSRSSPIECFTDEDLDSAFGADPDPVTEEEFDAALAETREVAARCGDKYGETLPYFSTEQAAHDLAAVREAVGDEQLTYLGYSYGTLLGAVHAQLYPEHIRAMVLDGAIDPREDPLAASEGQARGFERAFDNFAAWCADSPDECPLRPDARTAVTEAMEKARSSPMTGEDGREASAGWIFWAVVSTLYTRDRWPVLAAAIDQFEGGDPSGVFELADAYAQREPDGTYSNMFDANTAIGCADGGASVTVEDVRELQGQWRDDYPLFGPPLAVGALSCALWPAEPDPYPTGPASGAPPLLIVGTTGDPATPYEQSAGLAEMLGVGVVLTLDGEGHTAYPENDCIAEAVNAYLIELTVPPEGTECS